MPFLLYTRRPEGGGQRYERVRQIPLAGNTNGLIYRTLSADGITGPSWTVESSRLLEVAHVDPAGHAMVIDPTPSREREVNLFQVVRVAGYSSHSWTPIMLMLDSLRNDTVRRGSEAREKQSFNDEHAPRDRVLTFLYLQGDLQGGSWNWGPVGRVNGPLLWPEAFAHFQRVAVQP